MRNKLLNFFKNLIIVLGLVAIVELMFFATSSYAASGESLGKLMRETISSWYRVISRLALSIFAIAYLIIILKLLADRTPERIKTLKESILRFIIMFLIVSSLHYIMIAVIRFNQEGVKVAKSLGASLSGINGKDDEFDLYETALSKAYEISAVPGFIGLAMYLLLVFYTYKFVFIYAKRFINVIVLMLIAPIMFVVSSIKKILTGANDGYIKKWTKEYLYNIFIQTLHALFYATLIGFTLKLSDNNENLIGALLALIIFGFIFKIDGAIRKIFDFVGGSTKIKSSKSLSSMVDKVGNFGEKIGSGAIEFGKDVKQNGFKVAASNSVTGFGKNLEIGAKQLPANVLNKTKNVAFDMKNKAMNTAMTVKRDVKDYKNILNGERVKANLTKYEIVRQYHIIEEAKGLEKLRQRVRGAGVSVGKGISTLKRVPLSKMKYIYKKADKFTRKKISEIQNDLVEMKTDLSSDIEMVKRLPKIIRKLRKRQEFVKNADGLNIDVTNSMMFVVNTNANLKDVVEELKGEIDQDISVTVFAFKKIGSQTFLSPVVGSPRMGMSILAEDRYERLAENRLTEVVTGQKYKKRKIKRPTNRQSKRAIRKAGKKSENILKNNKKINKFYKFSRFNPNTVRKINNRMLAKSIEESGYLIVLNKTYKDAQVNKLTAVGTIRSKTKELSYNMKAVRKNVVKSVRQLKLKQRAEMSNYKELKRQTERVERAHNVGNNAMNVSNKIKLGFRDIENMTTGQLGLRKMIKSGTAHQMSNGTFLVRKENSEEKIKATGIVKENKVVQFVINNAGNLVQQVVSFDGKIEKPAMDEKGKIVAYERKIEQVVRRVSEEISPKFIQTDEKLPEGTPVSIPVDEKSPEGIPVSIPVDEKSCEGTPVSTPVDKKLPERTPASEISFNGDVNKNSINSQNDTVNKGKIKEVHNQVENQIIKDRAVHSDDSVQSSVQHEVHGNDVSSQFLEANLNVSNDYELEESSEIDTDTHVQLLETLIEDIGTKEITVEEEKIVQHIVTLDGKIVEQVINSNNEIETERYVILDKGVNNVTDQIYSAISDEELGVSENTSSEERFKKFEDLLQDLNNQPLLDQILQSSTEEEKELDEIIAVSSLKAENTDLRYLDYNENEIARKAAIEQMLSSGILTSEEASNDDIVGEAINVLNKRVEELSEAKSDIIFDKALEMDYVRSVEETLHKGEFETTNKKIENNEANVDEKVENLSKLLEQMAKQKAEEIVRVPYEIVTETYDAMKDVLSSDIFEDKEKVKSERTLEKKLQEAEKKWAKVTKSEETKNIAKKIRDQEEEVKITFQFFGAVENPGQGVTLTNRHTIREFYEKAKKLEGANLQKTQMRFLQENKDKLSEMQLMPFSFANYPVSKMDRWVIYVVSDKEDVPEDEKNEKQEEIEEDVMQLLNKYYSDFKRVFVDFIEETKIKSFDDLHNDVSKMQALCRKFNRILYVKNEKNNQAKAKKLVDNIHKDIRFKNILKDKAKNILAEEILKEGKEKTANMYEQKSREDAEKDAEKRITDEEVAEEKNKQERSLIEEVLEEASQTINPELQDLLSDLGEIRERQKLYIEVNTNDGKNKNTMKLNF